MAGNTLTDPEIDKNNPGETRWNDRTSQILNNRETANPNNAGHDGSTLSDNDNRTIRDLEDSYRSPAISDNERNTPWSDKTTKGSGKAKSKFGKKKKLLTGLGIGGGAAIIIAIVMMLLPLKLEMFIQNITKHAMKVSSYGVERRTDVLITRAIAGRMMDKAFGAGSGDVVMCKGGGIACSLYKTYTTNFIEKKFDLKFGEVDGLHNITVESRSGVGGNGHSWKVNMSGLDPKGFNEGAYTKFITSNSEMKKLLSDHVKSRIPDKGVMGGIKRFISRKVLMRKYGVTTWRGFPEKASAKLADLRAEFKAKMIKVVYGSISSRLAIAMGCLDDPKTCEKTLDNVDKDRSIASSMLSDADASKLDGKTGQDFIETLMKTSSKAVAKYALAFGAAATGIGAIFTIDTIITILQLKESGALDKSINSVLMASDITFAYGDEVGVVTNDEKLKAGNLDMDTLGVMSSMFDGAVASPLMEAENGISNASMASLFGGSTANAADGDLKSGQLVPDNRKFNQNITDGITGGAAGQEVISYGSGLIDFWMGTVHQAINAISEATIGNVVKLITDNPVAKDVMSSISKGATDFVMSFFGFIPQIGIDQPAVENYIALSGGIRVESNELMENGVDENGLPSGAGGQALSPAQVAAVYSAQDTTVPQPSYLASLFSPQAQGSLTQQLAIMMPSSGIGVMSSIMNIPGAIFSGLSTTSFAADVSSETANNPFGQVLYGYPVNSPYFDASPDNYTPQSCADSAKARDASLEHVAGVPWEVYTKADPCALEKTVVGALLNDAGVTDDEYSLKDPMKLVSGGDNGTTSVADGNIDRAHLYDPSDQIACAPGTEDAGVTTGYYKVKPVKIRLCNLPNTSEGGKPAQVNSRASGAALNLINALKQSTGVNTVGINDSFRPFDDQVHAIRCAIRKGLQSGHSTYGYTAAPASENCSDIAGYAAQPGTSNHGMGYAFDFQLKSGVYSWLTANASTYGYSDHTSESWHWSVTGG